MDNIYKAVQLTIDSQNLALSKTPTHVYIANQYVDTNDTPLITAPFIIQKALENGTGVVDIVSSTIGSIYEVRLLCDAEVLISGYFYMPPMNTKFSELELYTSYPPRTPPVINEFWQKTEQYILEKTNTLLNFVQVFNSLSSMRLSLGYLEELLTTKKSNLVSAINEVVSVKADKATTLVGYGISDAYTKSEIDTNYGGVKTLYDKNVAAGAGANGWTTDLVAENGLTQKQINAEQEEFKKISTFNVVNALKYIDKSQHEFIKDNNLSAQNQTLVTNGIKAAITAAQSLKAAHFILPSGTYVANDTLIFDLPNDSTLSFYGTVASTCVGKELVIVGSKTTNRFRYTLKDISAYYYHPTDAFYNIKNDTNKTSTAVLLLNIAFCEGNIKQALNCYNGVLFDSTQPNGGISYNVISLGHLHDNIKPLRFKMSQGGYTNENTTIGGSMVQSSNFPYTGEEVDVTFGTGIGSQKINNNLVFRPSLEANNANVKAAIIEGEDNQIYMPRIENSKDYAEFKIIFGTTSNNCSVKGLGFGLSERNIQDNGVNNKYETSSGVVINGDSAISALKVKNISSSSAKAIAVSDTSDNVTFDIAGDGTVYSAQHGYFANGIRWLTSDGTNKDKGIFVSTSNPENNVAASVGSLHINTSTGVISYKKYGSGNTGWYGFQDVAAGSTTYRPTNPSAGYQYFDTTVNKPIWWTGTKWVDASGNQV